jgi:DNA mismatch repair ATPase MutS
MLYFLFNILTLWDYQCEIDLERWKKKCGKHIGDWFETIGFFEALSSLSVLKYANPHWTFPELVGSESMFTRASRMGHPLITKDRVLNDIEIAQNKKVMLVTGSNMSGKSTFLRTVGLNLILAYAGAPVCAEAFSCSLMNVYTCMRVSDNLEKNISSFSKTRNAIYLIGLAMLAF